MCQFTPAGDNQSITQHQSIINQYQLISLFAHVSEIMHILRRCYSPRRWQSTRGKCSVYKIPGCPTVDVCQVVTVTLTVRVCYHSENLVSRVEIEAIVGLRQGVVIYWRTGCDNTQCRLLFFFTDLR